MNEQSQAVLMSGVLGVLVVMSAIACVYARHESRSQFSQLQSLITQRDALEVDWGRLRIEQSTWSSHSRVEQLARARMQMRSPVPAEVRVVGQAAGDAEVQP